MKHTYKIIFAILLVVALAVPAFASDLPMQYKYRSITMYDHLTVPIDHSEYPYVVLMKHSTGGYYEFFFMKTQTRLDASVSGYVAYWITDGDYWYVSEYSSKKVYSPYWSNYDVLRTDGTVFCAATEPKSLVCDGTSCPATDANVDGICDDCSMTLSLRSLTYPALPSTDGSNVQTALVKTKYSGVDAYMYSVFSSSSTYTIQGTSPGTVYQLAVDGVAQYKQYVTTDGKNWVEIQDGSVNDQTVGSGVIANTTVVSSTFNWYDESGNLFFPVPLWEEVGQVTQGETEILTQETMETMRTILLCGVGCLALLIGLNVFGRILGIFRT